MCVTSFFFTFLSVRLSARCVCLRLFQSLNQSVSLSVCLSVYPSTCFHDLCLSVCLPDVFSKSACLCMSLFHSASKFTCPVVCLLVCVPLPISLSVSLPVCLHFCQCVWCVLCLPDCVSAYLYPNLAVCFPALLLSWLPICTPVCLFLNPPVCPSAPPISLGTSAFGDMNGTRHFVRPKYAKNYTVLKWFSFVQISYVFAFYFCRSGYQSHKGAYAEIKKRIFELLKNSEWQNEKVREVLKEKKNVSLFFY